MNDILDRKLKELTNSEKFSCWYLVKQPTSFFKLCYLVSFLEEYQQTKSEERFETFIVNKIQLLNKNKSLDISDNYRALLVASYFGLIKKTATKGQTYKDSIITDTYYEVKKRCNGEFERTDLYQDVIQRQIEKIYLSTAIDDEYNGIRSKFKLYPVMFLYKILLEMGETTGDYSITLNEYEYLVDTTEKYEDYLETLFLLFLYRKEDQNDIIFRNTLSDKFDNRFKQILKQLKTLRITSEKISIQFEFLEEVKKKVFYFEQSTKTPDLENYFDFLGSTKPLINYNEEEVTKMIGNINKPHNRITFGAPGTGKSFQLNEDAKVFGTNFERVTFHPNYSYAQFVGTYKPTMSEPNKKTLSDEQQRILSILQDANKTSQEKYDLLYENFKDGDLTRLPILLGLFADDNFKTKKADGTPAVGDNSVERNHGKAIRPYVNLPVQDSSDEKQIAYQYVSGPFMRIYAAAKQNPNNNYLLLIEEINRANVAAVFGDVFQLLDRNADGESEYKVAASEDIKKYLAKKGIYEDELSIPSNMYIWATMNSADQGVFPMDTAFKRRWEFEYIGIDDNEDKVKNYEIPINSNQKVNWNELRKAINTRLIEMSINEDKLLGPFFLSKTVLEKAVENLENFVKLFKSKVIMYLFEDAAKMKVKQLFKIDNNKYIFSEICKQFDEKGLDVFQIDTSNIKLSEIDNTKEDVVVSEGNIDTPSLFE